MLALAPLVVAALAALVASGAWFGAVMLLAVMVLVGALLVLRASDGESGEDGDDEGDGGLGVRPPDRPRSSPDGPAIDWEAFDRARGAWERRRTPAL